MSKKIGEDKVHEFRRSWDVKPEALDKESPYHPLNIDTYEENINRANTKHRIFKDTSHRVL